LSGFFSKDSILARAVEHPNHAFGYSLFALGGLVAVLTAFYMFRLVFVVFFGEHKSDAASHAHESPPVMLWPLRLLALFSIIGGRELEIEALYNTHFDHSAEHLSISPLAGRGWSSCGHRRFRRRLCPLLKGRCGSPAVKIGSLSQSHAEQILFR